MSVADMKVEIIALNKSFAKFQEKIDQLINGGTIGNHSNNEVPRNTVNDIINAKKSNATGG